MDVQQRPVAEIKPYDSNPRVNDPAVDAVAASIEQFGFRQPIVVDEDGVIVVGHTRLKAAAKLGLAKVPVHVAKDLTPEQRKAYRIADNKTADLAVWDLELLPAELAELQAMDVDLGVLGFSEDDLARFLDPGVNAGLTDPDDVSEPPGEVIVQQGDNKSSGSSKWVRFASTFFCWCHDVALVDWRLSTPDCRLIGVHRSQPSSLNAHRKRRRMVLPTRAIPVTSTELPP